jgi:hypothetical protein
VKKLIKRQQLRLMIHPDMDQMKNEDRKAWKAEVAFWRNEVDPPAFVIDRFSSATIDSSCLVLSSLIGSMLMDWFRDRPELPSN